MSFSRARSLAALPKLVKLVEPQSTQADKTSPYFSLHLLWRPPYARESSCLVLHLPLRRDVAAEPDATVLLGVVHSYFLPILSLRNLVSGYACGRVFLAGVEPTSLLRDAVNWLSLRFSLSVETRWRYGWLKMVFRRCALPSSSNLVPFGRWWHARGRGYCRGEPGSASSGGFAPIR